MAEQVFTRVTNKEQLLALANVLAGDFPHSVTLESETGSASSSIMAEQVFTRVTNKEQLLALANVLAGDFPHSVSNLPSLVFFHCRESEVNNLIQAIKKINQYKKQEDLIYTVPQYLEEPLQMLTQETKTHIRIVRFHSFIYQPHLDTDPLSLDDREGHLSINK
ncbi:uncharacterized protein [Cherax quadricarinatus]|uniref:uncharacterized protein isoform X5 n=1 Tax=Cherax quadricarinatus TaxID=27406 RepID=UPI00387EAF54